MQSLLNAVSRLPLYAQKNDHGSTKCVYIIVAVNFSKISQNTRMQIIVAVSFS